MCRIIIVSCVLLSAFPGLSTSVHGQESTGAADALDIFNQRILPIFRSSEPSSCIQCHLASVDLKEYILPSHRQTFLSLRDQGLIDLQSPEKSKILTLIRMGDRDRNDRARLIHEKMRRAEFDAFAAWIRASARDPVLRNLPPLNVSDLAKPEKPDAVIRHARRSRVVDSFARTVWSQRMRCFPCHTPFEIDASDPRQAAAVRKQREFEEKYPDLVDRLKIFRETPEATLDYLIEASRNTRTGDLPLINVTTPEQSLLILKPLSRLPEKNADGSFQKPSSSLPVSHMGGLKMHPNDHSYKSFMLWLTDYARVTSNTYTSVRDLPADNWTGTNRILRLLDTPAEWETGTIVQLFVHRRASSSGGWSDDPVAFTQGTVTPRHIVNGALFLLQPASAAGADSALPRDRYQIRVYVDRHNRLASDPTLMLGADDLAGTVELARPRWREGFRQAETVSWKKSSTATKDSVATE